MYPRHFLTTHWCTFCHVFYIAHAQFHICAVVHNSSSPLSSSIIMFLGSISEVVWCKFVNRLFIGWHGFLFVSSAFLFDAEMKLRNDLAYTDWKSPPDQTPKCWYLGRISSLVCHLVFSGNSTQQFISMTYSKQLSFLWRSPCQLGFCVCVHVSEVQTVVSISWPGNS